MYSNAVDDQAELNVREFNAPTYLQEERMMTFFEPTELRRTRFAPTLSLSRELRWIENSKKSEPLSTEEVAHRILSLFMDLLSRADKGEIDLTHI
jgi:hypothetical protein